MIKQSIKKAIMPLLIVNCTLYIVLLFTSACKQTTEPPIVIPDDSVANTILLSVEWTDLYRIHLRWNKSKSDTLDPYLYRFTEIDEQGNKRTKEFTISGSDTSYTSGMVDSLISGGRYWFKVEAFNKENKLKDTSRTVESRTLSPTNHDIEWMIDTLGQPGGFLYDVWGLDENNVYAVGYVNLPGGGSGIIKWNGTQWNPFPASAGVKYGIFGFSESSIYVVGESSNRGFAGIWNGSGWTTFFSDYFYARGDTVYPLNAVWGSSPNDVWAVGDFGTIIHWDGVEWRKVESPTNKFLTDIWGSDWNNIYAIGFSLINEAEIIHYDGIKWKNITSELNTYKRGFISTWVNKNKEVYAVGTSIIHYDGNRWNTLEINQTKFLTRIRGRNATDVVAVGQRGRIHHYNGMGWQTYPELYRDTGSLSEIKGVIVFEKQIIAVGWSHLGALVYRGKRN